jgi:hypothetical protein
MRVICLLDSRARDSTFGEAVTQSVSMIANNRHRFLAYRKKIAESRQLGMDWQLNRHQLMWLDGFFGKLGCLKRMSR